MRLLLLCCILFFLPAGSSAQQLADTLFQWQGYTHPGKTRLLLFKTLEDNQRSHVAILQEQALNKGPTIQEDFSFLVEEIGRNFQIDPAETYWVLHWGAFSFVENASSSKDLFLRATFRRNQDGRLGSPLWRLIRREDVEELTDRLFQ